MIILMGTGFFIAIFWPTMMCSIMEVYQSQSSTPTSIVVTIQGILIVFTNYFQGLINEKIGEAWGYRTTVPLCVLTLILLYFLRKSVNSRLAERANLLHNDVEMIQIPKSDNNNTTSKENNKNNTKSDKSKNIDDDDGDSDDDDKNINKEKDKEEKIEIKVERSSKKQIAVYSSSSSEGEEDNDEKSNLIAKAK